MSDENCPPTHMGPHRTSPERSQHQPPVGRTAEPTAPSGQGLAPGAPRFRLGSGADVGSEPPPGDQAASASLEQISREWYNSLHTPRPLLVVVSGPSGVGKDATILHMKERGYTCHFVVTATTRPRRRGEIDGVDYYFVSEATFTDLIASGELMEHALVYGQYKGIPKAGVRAALASGQDVILRIDVQGAATIRRLVPEAITVFLTAESEEALVDRLRRRRTEDPAQLERRIETARGELRRANEFKYRIVNRECALDETVDCLIAIIQAEKSRIDWRPVIL
jgi:guanylate kinase